MGNVTVCDMAYFIDIKPTNSISSPFWNVLESSNIPDKIYYRYDWQSSVHYDYMRYNADSAILTFAIENSIVLDTIVSIDSAYIIYHDSPMTKEYFQLPVQIKDTISILDDATFNYTIGGLLRGQNCGEANHCIKVHKNEIVSKQNETHYHQGETYEYDE